MDPIVWLGIITAGLVALLAAGYVIWPLIQPGPTLPLIDDSRLTELLVRKDILLRSIKDLELDRQMGKISEEDFQRFMARLRSQAITVMRQLDAVSPVDTARDDALEAEIARLRKVQQAAPVHAAQAVPSAAPATPTGLAPRTATRFCIQCGEPVAATHKFCAACGAAQPGTNQSGIDQPGATQPAAAIESTPQQSATQ